MEKIWLVKYKHDKLLWSIVVCKLLLSEISTEPASHSMYGQKQIINKHAKESSRAHERLSRIKKFCQLMFYKRSKKTFIFPPLLSHFMFRWFATHLIRHAPKPGLDSLAWSGLKVGPASLLASKLACLQILAWPQKMTWPQIWRLQNVLPQMYFILFFYIYDYLNDFYWFIFNAR